MKFESQPPQKKNKELNDAEGTLKYMQNVEINFFIIDIII